MAIVNLKMEIQIKTNQPLFDAQFYLESVICLRFSKKTKIKFQKPKLNSDQL